jgi:nucleoside-diphosphate-sugar epimerase
LRYFTVYGPAGRPDMSIFRFIEQIKKDVEIVIYGDGAQERDFTYIDDIVAGTIGALKLEGFNIINLGNDNPVKLNSIITLIEKKLHKKAKKVFKDFHKADMEKTWANINKAKELLKWQPEIDIEKGINKTVNWHLENASFLKDINL